MASFFHSTSVAIFWKMEDNCTNNAAQSGRGRAGGFSACLGLARVHSIDLCRAWGPASLISSLGIRARIIILISIKIIIIKIINILSGFEQELGMTGALL